MSQCAENPFFLKLFSPSVCLHLFVRVFFFIFLSVDSIITTIKKASKDLYYQGETDAALLSVLTRVLHPLPWMDVHWLK